MTFISDVSFIFLLLLIKEKCAENIDLSKITYSVSGEIDYYGITFKKLSEDKNLKIKCFKCEDHEQDGLYLNCKKKDFVKVTLEVSKDNLSLKVPFNISCDYNNNDEIVRDIKGRCEEQSVNLSWNISSKSINTYIIYYYDNNNNYYKIITTKEESYELKNLEERTWYHICLATINNKYQTGKYKCIMKLTDFRDTGPVVNVNINPSSYNAEVSWSEPDYKEDLPQGYVVTYFDSSGACRSTIIIMRNSGINTTSKCSVEKTMKWDNLERLTIRNLRPYTDYNMTIYPINQKKRQKVTLKLFKTKEGESGPVSNIKWFEIQGWFRITFDKPKQENGNVKRYMVKVVLIRLGICKKMNEIIYTKSDIERTYVDIKINLLKTCAEYHVKITPINGWSDNGGRGRMTDIIFEYKPRVPLSISNLETKFISSNVARVSWHHPLINDHCSYIIEVQSQKERSKCFKMIISDETCQDLQNITEKESKCEVKEISSQIIESSRVVYFGDEFISEVYEMSLWRISHSSYKQRKTLIIPKMNDCFTDCYNSKYGGIRSAKGCVKWKDSSYKSYSTVNNNFCIKASASYTWCSTALDNSWVKCNVKQCSKIRTFSGCVNEVSSDTKTNTSTIRWATPQYPGPLIGYLTLLYNLNNDCEQSHIQICENCPSETTLDQQIKDFYIFCKLKLISKGILKETTFNNLHQNKEYIVYIIPLITESQPGEVKKTSIRTLLAVPAAPKNIKMVDKTTSSLLFRWDNVTESVNHGLPDSYEAQLIETFEEKTFYKESVEFLNLKMCTKYCLRVNAKNKAGRSESSKILYHYTLAPSLGEVKVNDIKSGPRSNRIISWTYSKNDNCDKSYKVQYRNKFMKESKYKDTKENTTTIEDLERNSIYVIQVRPETNVETVNNKRDGEYSESLEFYTGEVNPSMYGYKEEIPPSRQRVNISWNFNTSYDGAIFQFILQLNSSNQCLESLNLVCSKCPYPYSLTNLNETEKSKRNTLLNCSNKNKKEYTQDNGTINYTFILKEPLKNFSIEIYALNLMGVHKVYGNTSFYKETNKSSVGIIILCFILTITIIIIVAVVIYKYKSKNTFVYNNITKFSGINNKSRIQSCSSNEVLDTKLKRTNSKVFSVIPQNEMCQISSIAINESLPILSPKSSIEGVPLKEFHKYFNKMNANNSELIIQEYKKLSIESKNMELKLGLTVEIGKSSTNVKKNRFVNILPFDQTRIILKDRSASNDYINANYIPFMDDVNKHEYIASQGPIEHSIDDFWQMISSQNVNCIIMLTRTMEENKFKCLQYWPEKIGETKIFSTKWKISVRLDEETDSESHIERLLIMKDEKNMEERKIIQLHMHTWFDHSAPNLEYFDKLLFRFHEIVNTTINPYLIHCSAGVGRTGTLICIDRIIKQLVSGLQHINIYDCVFSLRHYRNLLVQRQAQYVFIHEYIEHFLKKYMNMDDPDEILYFNEN